MKMQTEAGQEYQLLHKIYQILQAAADRLTAFAGKVEAVPGKIPELMVMFIYAAAHLGMAVFHEPFFDEAEAWQIARCVSLKTLLFETTHYEGHPPLWHLILMPLAKAGAPYELSLTLVSLVFMGVSVFLILRCAPFPRIVRLLLPFTYFYFYQYGVISRVYCVMVLEFVLLAMAYRSRNEKPGRYVAVMMILCMTTAYGLVIAGGLALVWLWEIWDRKGIRGLVGRYGKDRRIWWLGALLVTAVCVILLIMPREDTYATAAVDDIRNPFWVRLFYMLMILPADVTMTNVYGDHLTLSWAFLQISTMISGCIVGVLIWFLLLYYGKKKKTVLLCVLPYGIYALFSAAVYVSLHHTGIGLLYLCFWVWVTVETEQTGQKDKGGKRGKLEVPVRCGAVLMGTAALGISIFWTVASCRLDIDKIYASGREEAKFIKEHHLDQYRVMSAWSVAHDEEGNIQHVDINECDRTVNIAPYFDHNIFMNFNEGKDDRNYIVHIRLTEEETQKTYDVWRKEGMPQVLWMNPDLMAVYGDKVNATDYVLVYLAPAEMVWKAGADYLESKIYVHRDLLKETGLQSVAIGK